MDTTKINPISDAGSKIDASSAAKFAEEEKIALPQDTVEISASSRRAHSKKSPLSIAPSKTEPSEPDGPPKKKWTILLYSAADNNLTSYMVDDVKEIETVGSDKNTNLVVQIDQGGSIGCKRYYLEKHRESGAEGGIASPVLENLGKIDMASPQVLADFIKWGVKKYPAEYYCLIISDHGDGWKGACEDDSHNTWMDMGEIKEGIAAAQNETGVKMDIIGFDACLMANTEVGYQLKDLGTYLVASEQTEGADGWPYQKVLTADSLRKIQRALKKKIDLPPADFAKRVVKKAEDSQGVLPTMSATDLTQMGSLAKAADAFAQAILDTKTPNSTLKSIARSTESFYGYKDYYDFAERIVKSANVKDNALKNAAKNMMEAIKSAVIAEQHSTSYPGAHGLTAEIPSWGAPGEDYQKLDFAKETKWDEAMKKMTS